MMSPNPWHREPPIGDALDRYWDALTQPRAADGWDVDPALDDALAGVVRRVQFGNDTPHAEPAFAARLWGELMAGAAGTMPAALPESGAGPLVGLPRRRVLMELLMAAALLLAVIGGGSSLHLPGALDPAQATVAAKAGGVGCVSAAPTVVVALPPVAAATLPPTPDGAAVRGC